MSRKNEGVGYFINHFLAGKENPEAGNLLPGDVWRRQGEAGKRQPLFQDEVIPSVLGPVFLGVAGEQGAFITVTDGTYP